MKKGLDEETRQAVTTPAGTDEIPRLIEFVSSYAREMAFEDKRISEIASALEETLGNIVHFACPTGSEEITITCDAHEMGALLVDIVDSGIPFNMLVMSAFPETSDYGSPDQAPPTRKTKKAIKNIEYRRDGESKKNILAWVVSR